MISQSVLGALFSLLLIGAGLAIVVLGYVDSQVDGAVARTRWRRTRGWPARLLGVALIGAGGWLWRWPEQGDTICLVLFFIAVGVHLAGMAQSDP